MADAKGIKMGQGYVSLGVDRGPLDAGLEAAKSQFQAWGKGIAALGAVIAAGGAAVAAPFLSGMGDFMTWGSEMRTVMRQTGMGFDEAQLAMNGFRISGEELPMVVTNMREFMVAARNGGAEATNALRLMGLSVEELNEMTDSERLNAFADGLNNIADTTQRGVTARDIFRRSATSMNFDGGSAGSAARAARMRELQGDSRSDEARMAAENVGRARGEMGIATGAIFQSLAFAAAPIMTDFYNLIAKIAIAVRQWTDANRPLLTTVFYIADKMILLGSAIGFLGASIYAASYAFTFFQGAIAIVGGVLSWLGGIVGGVVSVAFWILSASMAVVGSGFGLLTLASAVWGAATSAWTGIVWAATVVYGLALTALVPVFLTLKAVSFAWWAAQMFALGTVNAMMIVGKVAILAMGAAYLWYSFMIGTATIGTGVYTLALIKAWIWENLVSLGINLIISAMVALVMAIVAVVVAFHVLFAATWFIAAIGPVIGGIIVWLGGWRDAIASVVSGFSSLASGVGSALSSAGAYIGQFFTVFAEQASIAFGHVYSIAMESFSAIKAAFNAGEWAVLWETITVTAQLAWIRLMPAVVAFKDGTLDLLRSMWVEVEIFALETWHRIKVAMIPIFRQALSSLAAVVRNIPGMEQQALALHNAGINLAAGAGPNAERLRRAEEEAQAARVEARRQLAEAAAAGDAPEVARLNRRLIDIQWELAETGGAAAAIPVGMPAGIAAPIGPGDIASATLSSAGSFSRFNTWSGAVNLTSETATERETRLARERLDELVRLAARQRGVVMM